MRSNWIPLLNCNYLVGNKKIAPETDPATHHVVVVLLVLFRGDVFKNSQGSDVSN